MTTPAVDPLEKLTDVQSVVLTNSGVALALTAGAGMFAEYVGVPGSHALAMIGMAILVAGIMFGPARL